MDVVVVLPCVPAIAMPALDAHDLGEHLGALDDGNPGGARGGDLGVRLVDGARVDDDVRAGRVLGAVALEDRDAERC